MNNQRLQDLEDNIAKDQELLKDFEDELRYEMNPRTIQKYRRDIELQKKSIASHKEEYAELKQELAVEPSAQIQLLHVEKQLQQMDHKINVLLNGQVAIYADINDMRLALLNRYDDSERTIIGAIAQQLNQNQLVLTQQLLDAVENNQVSESQMQQMLAVLEEKIPSETPSQTAAVEIIKDPQFDARHKIKVTLPIIPMLVEYEGELELGSGLNIKSAWEDLIAKLRRK
ncbi:MAG: hypothetical protein QNJ63_04085 [Calothrix sp. MO_192.B10]|nr:hypothetical protein [Calothrix sp. MO_192.B10]